MRYLGHLSHGSDTTYYWQSCRCLGRHYCCLLPTRPSSSKYLSWSSASFSSPGSTTTVLPADIQKRACTTQVDFATLSRDAKAAADSEASSQHVRVTAFSIDANPKPVLVHVTINKQARSIIVIHTPWRHYDDVDATAQAQAG